MIKKSRRTSATVIACCTVISIVVTILLYISGVTVYAGEAMENEIGGESVMNWYGAAFISFVLFGLLIAVIVAK